MQGLLANQRARMAAHIANQFIDNKQVAYNDNLEKGIADEFRYGEGAKLIQIKKSGKDIKAALNKERSRQESLKQTSLIKLDALQEDIGEDPTQPASNWKIDKYPNLPAQPNSYDVYSKRETLNTSFTGKEECDALCQKMYQYNSLCYYYSDACVQVCMLDTIINNLEDKKTYPLSLELATMLGF